MEAAVISPNYMTQTPDTQLQQLVRLSVRFSCSLNILQVCYNSNGYNFRKINLDEVFKDISSETLAGLVRKYEMDFQMCGYEATLAELRRMIDKTG